jgi:hypothetical protein
MNENDRLPSTALQIVQSCVVDLDPLDLGATGLRLTCSIPDGYAEREQRSERERPDAR